jgi:hypothetical protein
MKMQRKVWKQFGVAVASAAVVVVVVVVVAAQAINSTGALPTQDDGVIPRTAIVSLAQALHDDRPMVVVYVPVERCNIQYCLTGELVSQRLAGQEINVVEAPVYAVPMQGGADRPIYPMIGWGVYLVEPFVNWLPEFSEDEFGYGLAATAAVLIDVNGDLIFRHQRLVDIDCFAQEVMAYAATHMLAGAAI